MGSGKTYWGKIWAKTMQMNFIDLDAEIEAIEGKSVAQIFETQGENYFREKESQILRELKVDSDSIIACGGGTPCFNDNISWMNKNGKTIWLKTDVSAILQRVLQEQNKRPLLKKMNEAEILFFIEQKLKEREPFYKQANIVLNTKDINENTIVNLNIK